MRRQLEHREQGIFVAEGEKVVRRLLESQLTVVSLLLPQKWVDELEPLLRARPENIAVYVAEKERLETLTGFSMYQGLLAVGKFPSRFRDANSAEKCAALVADRDRQPFECGEPRRPGAQLRGLQSAIPAHWRDFVQPISSPGGPQLDGTSSIATDRNHKLNYCASRSAGARHSGDRCPSASKKSALYSKRISVMIAVWSSVAKETNCTGHSETVR